MLVVAIILTIISILLSIILIIFSYKKQDHTELSYHPYDIIIRILAASIFIVALVLYYFSFK